LGIVKEYRYLPHLKVEVNYKFRKQLLYFILMGLPYHHDEAIYMI